MDSIFKTDYNFLIIYSQLSSDFLDFLLCFFDLLALDLRAALYGFRFLRDLREVRRLRLKGMAIYSSV